MPIPVISYLERSPPTNPNYPVVFDKDFGGGWRSVADIAARDAIALGLRQLGMRVYVIDVDQVYRLTQVDPAVWALETPGVDAATEIYLDAAGDDTASGDQANPIASIAEAIRRTPQRGLTRWFVGAGTFAPDNYNTLADYERDNIISGDKVFIRGTNTVIDTVQFASVVNNVITCTKGGGSPGWTANEHVGRKLRWWVFGPTWEDYGYSWVIVANTANTLTCMVSWAAPGVGGSLGPPGVGTDLEIIEHGTKFARNATSDDPTNKLFTEGYVIFQDIHFDGTLNGGGKWGVTAKTNGSVIAANWCTFESHSLYSVDCYYTIARGCHFKDSATGLYTYGGIVQLDCYFENCTYALRAFAGGGVALAHGDYVWAKDCTYVVSSLPGGIVDDGSIGVYLDNCDYYGYLADGGHHRKTASALVGFDATKRTLNNNVFWMDSGLSMVDLYASGSTTVGPDVGFLNFSGTLVSLTDYIAGGGKMEDELGNRVIG